MAAELIDIIKRDGKRPSERFNRDKLQQSLRAACASVRSPEGESNTAANSVCNAVIVWVTSKPEVTSADIRRIAAYHLNRIHPEAAYIYKHHRLVL